jgi:hypothetical protein
MTDENKKETGLTAETAKNTEENKNKSKKGDNTKNLSVLCELACLGKVSRSRGGKRKNTWFAKIKRTFTSVLPVSQRRKGKCISCGACCRLPNVCPFLKCKPRTNCTSEKDLPLPPIWITTTDGQLVRGKFYCSIYLIRPLNCRKYPRTESEFITADTCGYRFE